MFKNNLSCKLGCDDEDIPEHCLNCPIILKDSTYEKSEVKFSAIYESVSEQIFLISRFILMRNRRNEIP